MKNLMNIVLTSIHNICFRTEIRKSFTLVNPTFPNIKWDLQGCSYHKLAKRVICRLAEAVGQYYRLFTEQRDHSDFQINTSILCLLCFYHNGIKRKPAVF